LRNISKLYDFNRTK